MWGIAMSPRPRISWYFMIVIDQGGFEAMIWFWNGPQNGRVFRVPMSLPPTRRCFEAVSYLQGTSSFSPVWSVCSFPPGRNRSDFAERVSMSQQWLSAWFIDRWSGTMRCTLRFLLVVGWFDQPWPTSCWDGLRQHTFPDVCKKPRPCGNTMPLACRDGPDPFSLCCWFLGTTKDNRSSRLLGDNLRTIRFWGGSRFRAVPHKFLFEVVFGTHRTCSSSQLMEHPTCVPASAWMGKGC